MSRAPRAAPLLLPTLLLLAGCAWLVGRYPLRAGLQDPRGSWATLAGGSWANLFAHALVYLLLALAGWLAVQRATHTPGRRTTGWIIGGWLAASLLLLAVYPGGESHDIFDYLFRGRMLDLRGASPLAVTPNTYPRDQFYFYISWHAYVDTYGPLWEYASAATARLTRAAYTAAGVQLPVRTSCPVSAAACSALIWQLSGYRLLAIAATGLSAALIAALVRPRQPQLVPAALAIWLWNPLTLVSTAVGAHNDALLLPLLLAALLLTSREQRVAGWLLLGLAAHIKLTALLFVPVLAIWALRRARWRALAEALLALALMLPLSWLLYAPLGGWQTLPRMLAERILFFANSPAWVVYQALQTLGGWERDAARALVNRGATLVFAGLALVLLAHLWRAARATDPALLLRGARDLTLAYLLVGSFWFQAWYLTWALVLVAALPEARAPQPWLAAACLGALLSNIAGDYLFQLPGAPYDLLTVRAATTLLLLLPLLAAGLLRITCGPAPRSFWRRTPPA